MSDRFFTGMKKGLCPFETTGHSGALHSYSQSGALREVP